jgi:hypothetical protein
MPSDSKAQAKFFNIAAHNPAFALKAGMSPGLAREWHAADKKRGTSQLPERASKKKR